jgi:alginate O-acetyltransferase complex protein AlgI
VYFDFSGYSDMAIGLGKMFGFKINENFNYPYIANSVQDLWRRWHISLATWFKEYVYIPLGGSRNGTLSTYKNLMIVFFLTGLWHGAAWTFVLWGVWNGLFIIIEKIIPIEKMLRFRLVQMIYVNFVFLCGLVFFRSETMTQVWWYFDRMFSPYKWGTPTALLSTEFIGISIIGFICCGFGTMLFNLCPLKEVWKQNLIKVCTPVFCCVIAYFSVLMLASNTYNPFIYFRF